MQELISDLEELAKELERESHDGFGVEPDFADGFDCGRSEAAERLVRIIAKYKVKNVETVSR
jgi:hypothetical protein